MHIPPLMYMHCLSKRLENEKLSLPVVQVQTLHLLNFQLKAKQLVQLATITRLRQLSLNNVTLEARNTIQRLISLQARGLCFPAFCKGLFLSALRPQIATNCAQPAILHRGLRRSKALERRVTIEC